MSFSTRPIFLECELIREYAKINGYLDDDNESFHASYSLKIKMDYCEDDVK